jgi:hypothetical protein
LRTIILKPSVIFSLLIYLIGIIGLGIFSDTVSFDGSDDDTETKNNDSECETIKDQNSEPQNKDISSSHTSDYSKSSKWYVERMKHAYEQMMEHEFKWLEEEKEEYEKTKVLPENSLHSIIAESREQDAKEMMAINEALNKFNLNEKSPEGTNDIGSDEASQATDNKRSIDAQATEESTTNKKSRIRTESEDK